jgi:cytosine/adenosine deaminase-related metal-dependent hydrolase
MPEKFDFTVRDAITWGTINGAEAMRLGSRTGSLTPGKQADVLVIGGNGLNMIPRPELVGSIVFQANPSNVRDVLIAGKVMKRDGTLAGVDLGAVRRLAEESRERVFANVLAHGPLLPEATPEFNEELNMMGLANIARAHDLPVAA